MMIKRYLTRLRFPQGQTLRYSSTGSKRSNINNNMNKRFEMSLVHYNLPEVQIGLTPKERGESKLLHYSSSNSSSQGNKESRNGSGNCGNSISDLLFKDIVSLVPSDAHMVFNNSRVMEARLWAHRQRQGQGQQTHNTHSNSNDPDPDPFEVMLLNPEFPTEDPAVANVTQAHGQIWRAMIRPISSPIHSNSNSIHAQGQEGVDGTTTTTVKAEVGHSFVVRPEEAGMRSKSDDNNNNSNNSNGNSIGIDNGSGSSSSSSSSIIKVPEMRVQIEHVYSEWEEEGDAPGVEASVRVITSTPATGDIIGSSSTMSMSSMSFGSLLAEVGDVREHVNM